MDFSLWYCNLWTLKEWVRHWLVMWWATLFISLSLTVLTYKVGISPPTIGHTTHTAGRPSSRSALDTRKVLCTSVSSLALPLHGPQDPDCIFICIPLGRGSLTSSLISIYAPISARWHAPVLTHVARIRSSFPLLSWHWWHTPPMLCVKIIVFPSRIPCRQGLSFSGLCHGL